MRYIDRKLLAQTVSTDKCLRKRERNSNSVYLSKVQGVFLYYDSRKNRYNSKTILDRTLWFSAVDQKYIQDFCGTIIKLM